MRFVLFTAPRRSLMNATDVPSWRGMRITSSRSTSWFLPCRRGVELGCDAVLVIFGRESTTLQSPFSWMP
jgi:hypothetical protein